MIAYDVATKLTDTELFPQYSIAGLISSITFVVSLSQEKGNTVEWNKHTHTHNSFKSLKIWEPNQSSKRHGRVKKARTNVPQTHFIEKCNSEMGELISLTATWMISTYVYKGEWYISFTVTCIQRKEYPKLIFFVM